MRNMILRGVLASLFFVVSGTAGATVINSLSAGLSIAIPNVDMTFTTDSLDLGNGITAYTGLGNTYTAGYAGNYAFGSNGVWSGSPIIALDLANGYFTLSFSSPVKSFLADVNWYKGLPSTPNAFMTAYNSSGVLETISFVNGGAFLEKPGYWGFTEPTSEITSISFTGDYIAIRDITVDGLAPSVPEPASWALIIAGFGLLGGVARQRPVAQRPA